MDPREPAGRECGKGKSAELLTRARENGGAVGNTCGTVCGKPQVRYPLTETERFHERDCPVGRSVSLPTFYFTKVWRTPT